MVTDELTSYITAELKKGTQKEQIVISLINNGWQKTDIDEAFRGIESESFPALTSAANVQPVSQTPDEHIVQGAELAGTSPTAKELPKKPFPKSKILLVILGLFLFISFIAGGYYLYFSPEKMYERVIVKAKNITTYNYDGEISVHVPNALFDRGDLEAFSSLLPLEYSLHFTGSADLSDLKLPKSKNQVQVRAYFQTVFDIELRTFPDTLFVRVNDLGPVGDFGFLELENKWFSVDVEQLFALTGVKDENIKDKIALTNEKYDRYFELLKKHKVLEITRQGGLENSNGTSVRVFFFRINEDKLASLISNYQNLFNTDGSSNMTESEIGRAISSINFGEGEIWIGTWDSYVYKLSLPFSFVGYAGDELTAKFEIKMNNYNMPVEITSPSDSTDIFTFFEELNGMSFNSGLKQIVNITTHYVPLEFSATPALQNLFVPLISKSLLTFSS